MAWKANSNSDLPLAGSDREWDGNKARERIFRWAGWDDNPHPEKARQGFFAYDDEDPKHKHAYKLPFADVINNRLMAVPHGISAVAAALEDARRGLELPDDAIETIRRKVAGYYLRKIGEQPPW